MTAPPYSERTLIDGRWFTDHTASMPVYRPRDGRILCHVPRHEASVVDTAVTAAAAALPDWSRSTPQTRAEWLEALADLIEGDAENLAEIISEDVGTPAPIARAVQVGLPVHVLRSTAAELREMSFDIGIGHSTVTRRPVGVVAAITPWNYPLHQSIAKVAGALAAGCTVVHKPSEVAPLALLRLSELVHELGLPAGVYNQVSGPGAETGEALVRHPQIDEISFTGSTAVGRRIAAWAGEQLRRVSLELGGKSASIVLPGADLEAAVRATVNSALLNSGQTCTALTRLLVPQDQLTRTLDLAATRAQQLEPTLGPLVSRQQLDSVQEQVRLALNDGARAVIGGLGPPAGRNEGFFARATVLTDVDPDAPIAQEEVFGPVLCVLPYQDITEALVIANGTRYGLAAAVWGPDDETAASIARNVRAGQIDLNGARFNPAAPFGGLKDSGSGRELGQYGILAHLEPISVQHHRPEAGAS